MALSYGALALGVVLSVIGQIILRTGVELTDTLMGQLTHPLTAIGFINYAAAGVCYVAAIKKIPISVAFPTASVSYVAVGVLSFFLWNEPFGPPQVGAMFLIGGGIYLLHQ